MRYFCICTAILFFAVTRATAQQPDSLDQMRSFLRVCNAYKKIPLRLDLNMVSTTNLIMTTEDTLRVHAIFYLQKGGSYVEFGELEQIADDSLLLMVSKKMKRMVLYGHHQSVTGQLKNMAGPGFEDSSLSRMAAKYTVSMGSGIRDTAVAELASRVRIFHTELPVESVTLKYNKTALQPFQVQQTRRSVMPVSKEDYLSFSKTDAYKDRLFSMTDSTFFVIREQVTLFSYEEVSHGQGENLPVKINDRIVSVAPGKYRPVAAYTDFVITQDF